MVTVTPATVVAVVVVVDDDSVSLSCSSASDRGASGSRSSSADSFSIPRTWVRSGSALARPVPSPMARSGQEPDGGDAAARDAASPGAPSAPVLLHVALDRTRPDRDLHVLEGELRNGEGEGEADQEPQPARRGDAEGAVEVGETGHGEDREVPQIDAVGAQPHPYEERDAEDPVQSAAGARPRRSRAASRCRRSRSRRGTRSRRSRGCRGRTTTGDTARRRRATSSTMRACLPVTPRT